MVPGRKFFLTAQAVGWTIPVVFLAVALSITGVSFRFGESCHINSKDGVETFWGPMLAVAAASVVTQSITFGYVAQVYLRSLFEEKPSTMQQTTNSQLPYTNSIRTVTAFQALRRIRRVISLQWRGILVVIIILADVIYFSTVFLQFDGTTQETPDNKLHAAEWMECMLFNGGEKIKCFKQAKKLVVDEGTAFSVLFLLSVSRLQPVVLGLLTEQFNGFWALILLGRMDIYSAWFDLIKGLFTPKKSPDEFISYNAHRVSQPGNSEYEMLESKKRSTASTMDMSIMKPEPILTIPQNLSALREYNPSTFSAELRGRTTSGLTSPRPFSLYADKETAISRSPPTSPFSPYHDSPDSYLGSNAPFAPYADSPRVSPVRSSPKYPEDVRIGLAK